jgi:long-subunit fatty acid transport protein
LEDRQIAGRSPNTLDSIAQQTVGVGGSFQLSQNLNVMAGVRYSQERERLDPLTNSVKDSQAVYVGTQIKF